MTRATLIAISYSEIPGIWPRVRDLMEQACSESGGKYHPVDVLKELLDRNMQLWTAQRNGKILAIGMTKIVKWPRTKTCEFLVCVGEEMRSWVHLLPVLERWAKDQGAMTMEPWARGGWERVLKPMGYKKTHVVLEKTL